MDRDGRDETDFDELCSLDEALEKIGVLQDSLEEALIENQTLRRQSDLDKRRLEQKYQEALARADELDGWYNSATGPIQGNERICVEDGKKLQKRVEELELQNEELFNKTSLLEAERQELKSTMSELTESIVAAKATEKLALDREKSLNQKLVNAEAERDQAVIKVAAFENTVASLMQQLEERDDEVERTISKAADMVGAAEDERDRIMEDAELFESRAIESEFREKNLESDLIAMEERVTVAETERDRLIEEVDRLKDEEKGRFRIVEDLQHQLRILKEETKSESSENEALLRQKEIEEVLADAADKITAADVERDRAMKKASAFERRVKHLVDERDRYDDQIQQTLSEAAEKVTQVEKQKDLVIDDLKLVIEDLKKEVLDFMADTNVDKEEVAVMKLDLESTRKIIKKIAAEHAVALLTEKAASKERQDEDADVHKRLVLAEKERSESENKVEILKKKLDKMNFQVQELQKRLSNVDMEDSYATTTTADNSDKDDSIISVHESASDGAYTAAKSGVDHAISIINQLVRKEEELETTEREMQLFNDTTKQLKDQLNEKGEELACDGKALQKVLKELDCVLDFIKNMEEQQKEIAEKLYHRESEFQAAITALDSATENISKLESELKDVKFYVALMEDEIDQANKAAAQAKSERDNLRQELTLVNEQRELKVTALEEMTVRFKELQLFSDNKKSAAEEERDTLKAELNEVTKSNDQYLEQVENLRRHLDQRIIFAEKNALVESEHYITNDDLVATQERTVEQLELIINIRAENEQLAKAVSAPMMKLGASEDKQQYTKAEVAAMENNMKALLAQINELVVNKETLERKISDAESERDSVKAELAALEKSLDDHFADRIKVLSGDTGQLAIKEEAQKVSTEITSNLASKGEQTLTSTLEELRNENRDLMRSAALANEKLAAAEEERNIMKSEIARLEKTIEKDSIRLKELKSQNEFLQHSTDIAAEKCTPVEKEIGCFSSAKKNCTEENWAGVIQNLSKQNKDLQCAVTAAEDKFLAIEEELEAAKKKAALSEAIAHQKCSLVKELESRNEELDLLATSTSEKLADTEAELDRSKVEVCAIEKKIQEQLECLHALKIQNADLEDALADKGHLKGQNNEVGCSATLSSKKLADMQEELSNAKSEALIFEKKIHAQLESLEDLTTQNKALECAVALAQEEIGVLIQERDCLKQQNEELHRSATCAAENFAGVETERDHAKSEVLIVKKDLQQHLKLLEDCKIQNEDLDRTATLATEKVAVIVKEKGLLMQEIANIERRSLMHWTHIVENVKMQNENLQFAVLPDANMPDIETEKASVVRSKMEEEWRGVEDKWNCIVEKLERKNASLIELLTSIDDNFVADDHVSSQVALVNKLKEYLTQTEKLRSQLGDIHSAQQSVRNKLTISEIERDSLQAELTKVQKSIAEYWRPTVHVMKEQNAAQESSVLSFQEKLCASETALESAEETATTEKIRMENSWKLMVEKLKNINKKLEHDVSSANEKLHSLEIERENTKYQIATMEKTIEERTVRVETLLGLHRDLEDSRNEVLKKLAIAEGEKDIMRLEMAVMEKRAEENLKRMMEELNRQIDHLQDTMNKGEEKLVTSETEIYKAIQNVTFDAGKAQENFDRVLDELQGLNKRIRFSEASASKKLVAAEERCNRAMSDVVLLKTKIEEYSSRQQQLMNQKDELQCALTLSTEKAASANLESDRLRKEVHMIEKRVENHWNAIVDEMKLQNEEFRRAATTAAKNLSIVETELDSVKKIADKTKKQSEENWLCNMDELRERNKNLMRSEASAREKTAAAEVELKSLKAKLHTTKRNTEEYWKSTVDSLRSQNEQLKANASTALQRLSVAEHERDIAKEVLATRKIKNIQTSGNRTEEQWSRQIVDLENRNKDLQNMALTATKKLAAAEADHKRWKGIQGKIAERTEEHWSRMVEGLRSHNEQLQRAISSAMARSAARKARSNEIRNAIDRRVEVFWIRVVNQLKRENEALKASIADTTKRSNPLVSDCDRIEEEYNVQSSSVETIFDQSIVELQQKNEEYSKKISQLEKCNKYFQKEISNTKIKIALAGAEQDRIKQEANAANKRNEARWTEIVTRLKSHNENLQNFISAAIQKFAAVEAERDSTIAKTLGEIKRQHEDIQLAVATFSELQQINSISNEVGRDCKGSIVVEAPCMNAELQQCSSAAEVAMSTQDTKPTFIESNSEAKREHNAEHLNDSNIRRQLSEVGHEGIEIIAKKNVIINNNETEHDIERRCVDLIQVLKEQKQDINLIALTTQEKIALSETELTNVLNQLATIGKQIEQHWITIMDSLGRQNGSNRIPACTTVSIEVEQTNAGKEIPPHVDEASESHWKQIVEELRIQNKNLQLNTSAVVNQITLAKTELDVVKTLVMAIENRAIGSKGGVEQWGRVLKELVNGDRKDKLGAAVLELKSRSEHLHSVKGRKVDGDSRHSQGLLGNEKGKGVLLGEKEKARRVSVARDPIKTHGIDLQATTVLDGQLTIQCAEGSIYPGIAEACCASSCLDMFNSLFSKTATKKAVGMEKFSSDTLMLQNTPF